MKPSQIKISAFLAAVALLSFIGAPALERAHADAAAARSLEELHRLDNASDLIADSERRA